MAGTLADVNDNNFQAEVIESETAVLVDFWAPWCSPCRVVAPILEEIAAEREDLRIVKLNIDDNQQTAAAFEVLSKSDSREQQLAKAAAFAQQGSRLVVVIDPFRRAVDAWREGVHTSLGDVAQVECDPVMPGFVLDVAAILEA